MWTEQGYSRALPVLKNIARRVYGQYSDDQIEDLAQTALIIAWQQSSKDDFNTRPTRKYLGQCINSGAYDLRMSCNERREAKLKNKRAKFMSLDGLMEASDTNSNDHEDDNGGWEPVDTYSQDIFSDTWWLIDALRTKGSARMQHVLTRIFEGDDLKQVAKGMGITLQSLRYHVKREALAILEDKPVIEVRLKAKEAVKIVEEPKSLTASVVKVICNLIGQYELCFEGI